MFEVDKWGEYGLSRRLSQGFTCGMRHWKVPSQEMITVEVAMLNTRWVNWEERVWIRSSLFFPLRPWLDLNIKWFLFMQEPNPRVIPGSYVFIG